MSKTQQRGWVNHAAPTPSQCVVYWTTVSHFSFRKKIAGYLNSRKLRHRESKRRHNFSLRFTFWVSLAVAVKRVELFYSAHPVARCPNKPKQQRAAHISSLGACTVKGWHKGAPWTPYLRERSPWWSQQMKSLALLPFQILPPSFKRSPSSSIPHTCIPSRVATSTS